MHADTTLPSLSFDVIRESILSGMRDGWEDYCRLFNDPPLKHRKAIEYVLTVSVAKGLLEKHWMDQSERGAIIVEMSRNTFESWAFPRVIRGTKVKRKAAKGYGKQRFDVCLLGQERELERPSRAAIEIKGVISGWRSINGDMVRLKEVYAATNTMSDNRISAVYSASLLRLDKPSEVWDGDRLRSKIVTLTSTFSKECSALFQHSQGRPVVDVQPIYQDTAEEAADRDPYLIEDGHDFAAATGALAVAIVGYERVS
jgi:hypothetical protein